MPSTLGAIAANVITNPPTAFPKVTVGGESFELRFTLTSSFFLEANCDIPAQDLVEWIDGLVAKKHLASMLMTMSGAMLGNEVNGKWKATPMLPQDLASSVTTVEWAAIMGIYNEALSKAAAAINEATKRATPAALPQTSEPVN